MSDDILSLEENRYSGTLSITKREEISNRWIETSQKNHDDFLKGKGSKCSYQRSLFKNLNLELFSEKYCSNMLNHVCQNTIDYVTHDDQFEQKYGLIKRSF